jgi:hypothetical protein
MDSSEGTFGEEFAENCMAPSGNPGSFVFDTLSDTVHPGYTWPSVLAAYDTLELVGKPFLDACETWVVLQVAF